MHIKAKFSPLRGTFNGLEKSIGSCEIKDLFISSNGILLGNGDGSFQNQTAYLTGSEPLFVAVGDFNNDTLHCKKKRFSTELKKDLPAGTREDPFLVRCKTGSVSNLLSRNETKVSYNRFRAEPYRQTEQKVPQPWFRNEPFQ